MSRDRPRPALARAARRALSLRCPRCGGSALFPGRGRGGRTAGTLRARLAGWFTMAAACPTCGLRFEREPGYWIGAIYVNYAVTATVAVAGYFVLWATTTISVAVQLALWVPFVVLFPLWFFAYSRSLWLALERLVNPGD